jgi:hypothetical protein
MTKLAFTIAGVLLLLLVAVDVYVTILDDRPRVGPLGDTINRATWRAGLIISRRVSRQRRHRVLNFIGPALVPALVVVYLALLTLGFGLIYYPRIHTLFRVSENFGTPAFWDAVYCPKPLVKAMHFQCKTFSCYTLLGMLEVQHDEREQIW